MILRAGQAALHIECATPGWCRCELLAPDGTVRYLGAESLAYLCRQLVPALHRTTSDARAGADAWVLSLSEAHHTIFLRDDPVGQRFIVRDAQGIEVATLTPTDAELRDWDTILRRALPA